MWRKSLLKILSLKKSMFIASSMPILWKIKSWRPLQYFANKLSIITSFAVKAADLLFFPRLPQSPQGAGGGGEDLKDFKQIGDFHYSWIQIHHIYLIRGFSIFLEATSIAVPLSFRFGIDKSNLISIRVTLAPLGEGAMCRSWWCPPIHDKRRLHRFWRKMLTQLLTAMRPISRAMRTSPRGLEECENDKQAWVSGYIWLEQK